MGAAFITLTELIEISGVDYDEGKLTRAEVLLPLVSDLIRNEGKAAGVDVDARIETDAAYASVVMLVCADVIARALRQATSGEPMSQESQSGLGYSWSGTYAIPGGGVAMSLMRNERKMLGFRRQKYGVMEIWDGSQEEQ
jgi:hypothetical protein